MDNWIRCEVCGQQSEQQQQQQRESESTGRRRRRSQFGWGQFGVALQYGGPSDADQIDQRGSAPFVAGGRVGMAGQSASLAQTARHLTAALPTRKVRSAAADVVAAAPSSSFNSSAHVPAHHEVLIASDVYANNEHWNSHHLFFQIFCHNRADARSRLFSLSLSLSLFLSSKAKMMEWLKSPFSKFPHSYQIVWKFLPPTICLAM